LHTAAAGHPWPAAPELVHQELFAFLTACQALCALKADAARQAGIDPDRISFTVTVRVVRDHAASHAIITPCSLDLARRQAIGDLLGDILPAGETGTTNASGNNRRTTSRQCNEDRKGHPAGSPTRSKSAGKHPHQRKRLNSPALCRSWHFGHTPSRSQPGRPGERPLARLGLGAGIGRLLSGGAVSPATP